MLLKTRAVISAVTRVLNQALLEETHNSIAAASEQTLVAAPIDDVAIAT